MLAGIFIIVALLIASYFDTSFFGAVLNSWLVDDQIVQTTANWETASSKRHIAKADTSINLIWQKKDVFLLNYVRDATFIANSEHVIFMGSLNRAIPAEIITLDSNSGQTLSIFPQAGSNGRSMSYSAGYFCIGHSGSGRIACYQASNGKLLWTDRIFGAQHIIYLKQIDTTLYATTSPDKTYVIDVMSGEILTEENTSGSNIVFWSQNGISYTRLGLDTLVAQNDNGKLWEANIREGIYILPAESEENIFIKSGRSTVGDVIGSVTAIRKTDGTILWEHENVVSSVGVSHGYVSFLTLDAELVVVEENTGEIVSTIQFDQKFNLIDDIYIDSASFAVVSTETKIFVYFGDSRQLFAFEFTSPES